MSERFETEVTTTCGYCGVGCRLDAHVADGKVVSISPADEEPCASSSNRFCARARPSSRLSHPWGSKFGTSSGSAAPSRRRACLANFRGDDRGPTRHGRGNYRQRL